MGKKKPTQGMASFSLSVGGKKGIAESGRGDGRKKKKRGRFLRGGK